jgi:hypothetical protein
MRIQETDRILKEARIMRHGADNEGDRPGILSTLWRKLTSVFRHR